MKRYIITAMSLLMILCLTGCNYVGEKAASQSIIYGVVATISLLLLIGYLLFVKKKNVWLTLLFSSVLVVNVGYTLLSVSPNLEVALWANRISYLGSVFLPFPMLMDIHLYLSLLRYFLLHILSFFLYLHMLDLHTLRTLYLMLLLLLYTLLNQLNISRLRFRYLLYLTVHHCF